MKEVTYSEIREKVLSEYIKGYYGFKKLGRKYGISSKLVKSWITKDRFKSIFEKADKGRLADFTQDDYDKLLRYTYKKHPKLRCLIKDIVKTSKPKTDYSNELLLDAKNGNQKAIDTIIGIFQKRIFRLGYEFAIYFGADLEASVQNAFVGFFDAVENYTFDREKDFSQYYGIFVIGYLQRHYERINAPFEISKQQMSYLYTFLSSYKKTIQKQGIEGVLDFISDEDCDNLKEESPYLYNYLSLNKTEITDDIPFYDTIEEDCFYRIFQQHVKDVLSTIPPREQEVLRMRFGIERKYPLTLEEVANYYNITRERVRQIEAKALRRLRNPKSSAILRSFLD